MFWGAAQKGLGWEVGREEQQVPESSCLPWRRKSRAWGSISGFVLTQTMTLGESLVNYSKLKSNSLNKKIPAQGPIVEEQRGGGMGMVA